jgi:3',5'-cyclic AMP phosphodiesterase CpdA
MPTGLPPSHALAAARTPDAAGLATPRRIVHLSDLHFGSPGVHERVEPLVNAILALAPTVVAVSGDVTRRATPDEFRAVRAFLDRLRVPVVVVPGNHDVPLAPWVRFRRRHERFLAHVLDDLYPFFTDGAIAVAGIDTTRSFGIDGGRARRRALASLAARFGDVPPDAFRVVVAHHPFTRQPGRRFTVVAQKSRRALDAFDDLGVDAVLTGHRHESIVVRATDVVAGAPRPYLLAQAGTATTHRGRRTEKGKNSFLVLDVWPEHVVCARHALDDAGAFVLDATDVHARA